MNNRDVAAIFEEMAALTEILGGDPFRIRSFHRIAKVILSLGEPLSQLLSQGRLASYPGLGTGALNRIKQIQISGSCAEHQRLLQQIPRSVIGLLELRGVGTKLVRTLSQQLGIESVDELERDLANGASGRTAVLGVPTHEMLRSAVAHFRRSIAPLTIAEAETIGIELRDALATQPNVVQIQLAGSLRRGKELIGDLDLLVAAETGGTLGAELARHPRVREVLSQGEGRSSVRLASGHQVDMRVLPPHNFGAALHYFTGSKQHNIDMRARALRLGFKLSDHGISRRDGGPLVTSGAEEREIFETLGLQWIPPEIREASGEIEAAERGALPSLIEASQIVGELLCQSTLGGGGASPDEWLEIARRRGLHYIAISDRLDRLSTPLSRYLSQLDALQKRAGTTRILRGIRLVLDGRPFPRDVLVELDRLDFIVGEPRLAQTDDEMANLARIVRSIDGAPFDCIVAPLQRRVRSRDAPPLDRSALCDEATRRGLAFGVVGDPERLDPDATFCRMAGERGIPLVLSSDPSVAADLDRIRFATVVARRGWVPHGRILNSWPIARLEQWRSAAGRRDAPIQTTESTASQRSGAALAQELASRPLDAALLARLRRYLEGEPDAELESALAVHGPNPLAAAFALIADRTNGD